MSKKVYRVSLHPVDRSEGGLHMDTTVAESKEFAIALVTERWRRSSHRPEGDVIAWAERLDRR